jgi:hypothetical protein
LVFTTAERSRIWLSDPPGKLGRIAKYRYRGWLLSAKQSEAPSYCAADFRAGIHGTSTVLVESLPDGPSPPQRKLTPLAAGSLALTAGLCQLCHVLSAAPAPHYGKPRPPLVLERPGETSRTRSVSAASTVAALPTARYRRRPPAQGCSSSAALTPQPTPALGPIGHAC